MWPFKSRREVIDWRRFEDVAAARLLKDFSDHHCTIQKVSRSTRKRPDMFLRSKTNRQRVIVDFKYSLRPKVADIKQVSAYKGFPFFAQRGILVYPKNALISEDFKKKAATRNIEIRHDKMSKNRMNFFKWLLRIIT
jgi:hypothetical protein